MEISCRLEQEKDKPRVRARQQFGLFLSVNKEDVIHLMMHINCVGTLTCDWLNVNGFFLFSHSFLHLLSASDKFISQVCVLRKQKHERTHS